MLEVDPGHEYLLDSYDGSEPVRLVFMKREGEGYPFNVGHHPGTNCQETIRALIARLKYLDYQIPSAYNWMVIKSLRVALLRLEQRAATRHGRMLPDYDTEHVEVEFLETCRGCGHVGCEGEHKASAVVTQPARGEIPRCAVCQHRLIAITTARDSAYQTGVEDGRAAIIEQIKNLRRINRYPRLRSLLDDVLGALG